MRNAEIERLEAKLKLWDTPGFSQFLNDLNSESTFGDIHQKSDMLKRVYIRQLKELKEKESKFKQGKLEL